MNGKWIGTACAGIVAGLGAAAGPVSAQALVTAPPVSAYLGGYVVPEVNGSISVTSIVQLPKATCANRKDIETLDLGEQLTPATGNVSQGGQTDGAADVVVYCSGSDATPVDVPEAFTTGGGDNYGAVASPGQLVQFTLTDSAGGSATATTTDLNTGQTVTSSGASTGTDARVYLGAMPDVSEEHAGSFVDDDIPKFSTIKFQAAIADGAQWSTANPQPYALEQNNDVQIKPSAVPATPSYGFTLTELHVH